MRLVADEGVDAPIVRHLRELGHTVWYVAEMAAGIADDEVLDLAQRENALLLTNDKDFGALVFQQRKATTGVILLRLSGLPVAQKLKAVGHVLTDYGDRLAGSFTVVTPTRVRIRPAR